MICKVPSNPNRSMILGILLTYAHVLVTCSARNDWRVHVFQPSSPEKNSVNISQIQIQETNVFWKIRKYCHIIGKKGTVENPGVISSVHTEMLWLKCQDIHFFMYVNYMYQLSLQSLDMYIIQSVEIRRLFNHSL